MQLDNFIGEAQWAWLERELHDAAAEYGTEAYTRGGAELVLIGSGVQIVSWGKIAGEGWRVFPQARQRLFDLIARMTTPRNKGRTPPAALLMSGDVHFAEVARTFVCHDPTVPPPKRTDDAVSDDASDDTGSLYAESDMESGGDEDETEITDKVAPKKQGKWRRRLEKAGLRRMWKGPKAEKQRQAIITAMNALATKVQKARELLGGEAAVDSSPGPRTSDAPVVPPKDSDEMEMRKEDTPSLVVTPLVDITSSGMTHAWANFPLAYRLNDLFPWIHDHHLVSYYLGLTPDHPDTAFNASLGWQRVQQGRAAEQPRQGVVDGVPIQATQVDNTIRLVSDQPTLTRRDLELLNVDAALASLFNATKLSGRNSTQWKGEAAAQKLVSSTASKVLNLFSRTPQGSYYINFNFASLELHWGTKTLAEANAALGKGINTADSQGNKNPPQDNKNGSHSDNWVVVRIHDAKDGEVELSYPLHFGALRSFILTEDKIRAVTQGLDKEGKKDPKVNERQTRIRAFYTEALAKCHAESTIRQIQPFIIPYMIVIRGIALAIVIACFVAIWYAVRRCFWARPTPRTKAD